MNFKCKRVPVLLIFLFISLCASAQKEKVSQEKITQVCENIPLEKRPRITVARFTVSSPTKPDGQFGENLASMLSNAIQGSGCFRVLERIKDSSDLMNEMNFSQSGNVDKKTAITKGKMLAANVIAVGEITKYEASSKDVGIGLLKTTKNSAMIGVLIKLVNPETRDIIEQQEFNVEKKTSGGMKVGVKLPYVGDLNITSSAMKNPAVQSAVEEAIKDAVEFISSKREKIPLPESEMPDNATGSTIVINNIDYNQLSQLSGAIQKITGVIEVNSDNFADNTATMIITHTLKLKELVEKIMQVSTGTKLSVKSLSKDGATLTGSKL